MGYILLWRISISKHVYSYNWWSLELTVSFFFMRTTGLEKQKKKLFQGTVWETEHLKIKVGMKYMLSVYFWIFDAQAY